MVEEINGALDEMPSEDADEKLTGEIEAMIRAENDPHWRGLLVIIQRLNFSVAADARLTRLLAKRLTTFNSTYLEKADAQSKILNQGIGGWKAFLVVGTLVGGLLVSTSVWVLNRAQHNMDEARTDRDALREETIKQQATDAAMAAQLDHIQRLLEQKGYVMPHAPTTPPPK